MSWSRKRDFILVSAILRGGGGSYSTVTLLNAQRSTHNVQSFGLTVKCFRLIYVPHPGFVSVVQLGLPQGH